MRTSLVTGHTTFLQREKLFRNYEFETYSEVEVACLALQTYALIGQDVNKSQIKELGIGKKFLSDHLNLAQKMRAVDPNVGDQTKIQMGLKIDNLGSDTANDAFSWVSYNIPNADFGSQLWPQYLNGINKDRIGNGSFLANELRSPIYDNIPIDRTKKLFMSMGGVILGWLP